MMRPEPESRLNLSKWPFYVGDGLLVSTALAIGFLGGGELSVVEVAACVTAVALGAGLLVLPFIFEHYFRLEEDQSQNAYEMQSLRKRVEALERAVEDVSKMANEPPGQKHLEKEMELFAAATDEKFETAAADVGRIGAALAELEDRVARCAEGLTDCIGKAESKAMDERFGRLEQNLAELERAVQTAKEDAALINATEDTKAAGLLQRAIRPTSSDGAAAVSRIIEAKPEQQAVPGEADSVEAPSTKYPDSPKPPETESTGAGADLFGETVPASVSRRQRARKSDSVVTVKALIGIGNRPYLRGSGCGLNWEHGQEMAFEAIGQWRWVASQPLDEPIEVLVYLNDAVADSGGRHPLAPGGSLEIEPHFPEN